MTLPVGAIIMYHTISEDYSTIREELSAQGWEKCDGTSVQNPASPLYGHKKPNLVYRFPLGAIFATGQTNESSHEPNQPHYHDGEVHVRISSPIETKASGWDSAHPVHTDPRLLVYSELSWMDGSPIVGTGHLDVTIDATPPFTTVWFLIKVLPN